MCGGDTLLILHFHVNSSIIDGECNQSPHEGCIILCNREQEQHYYYQHYKTKKQDGSSPNTTLHNRHHRRRRLLTRTHPTHSTHPQPRVTTLFRQGRWIRHCRPQNKDSHHNRYKTKAKARTEEEVPAQ